MHGWNLAALLSCVSSCCNRHTLSTTGSSKAVTADCCQDTAAPKNLASSTKVLASWTHQIIVPILRLADVLFCTTQVVKTMTVRRSRQQQEQVRTVAAY